ncbi:MAG: ORF6N domain-containing protein [Candidatus Cloacimonetes bacterium]|nr:ORF6N domain-containing protein [Candidatus Cloacimonadota bacterium]
MTDSVVLVASEIEARIFTIRGMQVMLDRDLAVLYEVPVKVLNQTVKRNADRFPPDFHFQLTKDEFNFVNLKSQIVTSSSHGGVRKLPYAYTIY